MNKMNEAFQKLFGDMYLAESKTAQQIFEYGYKAGLEEAAKVCDEMDHDGVMVAADCAAAIRARMK